MVVEERKAKAKGQRQACRKPRLEELFSKVQAGEEKELRLIIKADVQGSLEPIINSVNDLKKGDIKINIIYAETGNIGENDVLLAAASKAIILGFNVTADPASRRLAEAEGVSIRLYDIIYRLIEDLEKALKGMLAPEMCEVIVGKAEVMASSLSRRLATSPGARYSQGEVRRNGRIRVMRGEKQCTKARLPRLSL